MAYPDDGLPKRWQVLEAIQGKLEAITGTGYHHDVKHVDIYETEQLVLGRAFPSIAIAPGGDTLLRNIACVAEDRQMTVTIFGALRYNSVSDGWKLETSWLASDIRKALSDDLQLDETALYLDFVESTVFDTLESGIAICDVTLNVVFRHAFADPTS